MDDGKMIADLLGAHLPVREAPEQIVDIVPAMITGVPATRGRCPPVRQAGLQAIGPLPRCPDQRSLVSAGELVDLLGAARSHTSFPVHQAAQPGADRSLIVLGTACDQRPNSR